MAEEKTPLSITEQQLDTCPPRFGNHDERSPILKRLDEWALAADIIYWDRKPETSNEEFAAFYRRRIDKVLREVARQRVTRGAAIWKMYSSGFIVKGRDGVLAIDVVEGPFKSIREDPNEHSDFEFKWTPQQRKLHAELVDIHLVTHWRYDHISYALCRLLAEAGKTVVVTGQLKNVWRREPFVEKLALLKPDIDHTLGAFVVRIFNGAQAMERDADGNWIRGPKDAENNIYWVRAGSVCFLHNGDNSAALWYEWLEAFRYEGKNVDVFFSILGWPRDMDKRVTGLFHPIIIPGHEHGMGHKPKYGVGARPSRYRGVAASLFARNKPVQLACEEMFVIGEIQKSGAKVAD